MFRSIRWRLILSYLFLAVLVDAVVGLATYQLAKNYTDSREIESLRINAKAIALQAEPMMWPSLNHYHLERLAKSSAFLGDMRVRILDIHNKALADSGMPNKAGQFFIVPSTGEQFPHLEEKYPPGVFFYQYPTGQITDFPVEFFAGLPPEASLTIIERHDSPWGKQFFFDEYTVSGTPVASQEALDFHIEADASHYRSDAYIIFPVGDTANPVGFIELSEPFDYGSRLLNDVRQALLIAGVCAVALAVAFGLWNSQRLASPLNNLAQTAAQMGAGDLSVRANLQAGGEIDKLAQQFNQMADNLQSSFDQLAAERDALRRFIADASHELRTPITALNNFNTLLLDASSNDPNFPAVFLTESQAQIGRLEWVTQNLLDLSRLDAGLLELDLRELDLCELIQLAVSPFKPIADEKGITLNCQLPDHPIPMIADRLRLEMALTNLLENAVKFTPQYGHVLISAELAADQVVIQVQDDGMGIPEEELPHIFERFYRGRSHTVEGSGLGLSIVKSVVEAHGGQISAESKPGEGTTLTLSFPLEG